MKSFNRTLQLLAVFLLFAVVGAYAQTDVPSNGACFYRDAGYRGSYFCVQSGQSMENVPQGFNDAIRSVRILGRGQVTIFSDSRFAGANTSLRNDVSDLRSIRLATDASRNWSERISSLRAEGYRSGGYGEDQNQNRGWNHQWGRGQQMTGGDGACFFEQPNFQGRSFCVDQGQALSNLPSGFNDRIQSIQVRGNSEVQIFNDNNFTGVAARTSRDVADLRAWRIPDDPSRNWSGRISSLRVDTPRGGGWNNSGGYGQYGDQDRDRDRPYNDRDRNRQYENRDRSADNDGDRHDEPWGAGNQARVHCSSRSDGRRIICDTQGEIRDARPVNAGNYCRQGESWGIDNGRLWVSNGCSADFEIRR